MQKVKYPKTYHLPWSRGIQSDDKINQHLEHFEGKEVVVLEKLDGENTTMYGDSDGFHARSLDSPTNWTRDWCKQLHSCIMNDIPEGYRFCGENMFATHSIEYNNLESFFYLFSIWDNNNYRFHWDDIMEWADILDLATPQCFYRGIWDENIIREITNSLDTEKTEGIVATSVDSFHIDDFSKNVAKWVREGHVQDNSEHWLVNAKPNRLHNGPVKPHFMM